MIDVEFLSIFIDEATEILERWEKSCLKLESTPSPETINELFRSAHNLKGSARGVGLESLGKFIHGIEDFITKLKNEQLPVNSETIGITLDCQKKLVEWITELKSNPKTILNVDQLTEKFSNKDSTSSNQNGSKIDLGTILVDSGHINPEQLETALKLQNRKLGEIIVASGFTSPENINKALEKQKIQGHKPDETIRISLKKLDSVIRLIGELSIQQSIILNAKETSTITGQSASEAINLSQKVIQDLQSETMSLRMQPLEGLFQRMERVARDVARQQNKKIKVILKGIEVELDKTVIEQMKDPLVHILRNAVDHGIENEEERVNHGKAAIATITIEGFQTAANVTIRISDDGQGLNEERILKKAKERKLVPLDASPTPKEIHNFIFMPGFSTAEVVTDVSGRGVGMDVVKRSVDDLGGDVEINSLRFKGTQFNITLPSTLSILDAIVVGLNGSQYAIPIQDIEEVIDMNCTSIDTSTKTGRLINLRGRIMPVEYLANYLPNKSSNSIKHHSIGLITRHQSTSVAFEVDKIEGQQSIVVRQLEGNLAKVPGFAGGTILASGEPSMIIHLSQIMKSYIATVKSA